MLAPAGVEALLTGKHFFAATLSELVNELPAEWRRQKRLCLDEPTRRWDNP